MSFYKGIISSTGELKQDVHLKSETSGHYAVIQADGNFCVYTSGGVPIWASHTNQGGGPFKLITQGDGNVCVYNAAATAIWASGSVTANVPVSLVMQDDGNLVLYDSTAQPIWATNTGGL
eukprot:TRINITY_DN1001_c0_g1_i4.p1 TRINITY_DN1001_c0_g1~~TRINITY_DN1001_c0_g1_i4.p1  ORF type:complete len:120 (+),score=14.64 TRINITY_DN1001_c0_g1_i4:807-1166(+)